MLSMNATTDSCGGLLLCAISRPVLPSLSVACVSQPITHPVDTHRPPATSQCQRSAGCRTWLHAGRRCRDRNDARNEMLGGNARREQQQSGRARIGGADGPASMSGCRQALRPWSHAQSQAVISNSLSTASAQSNPCKNNLMIKLTWWTRTWK